MHRISGLRIFVKFLHLEFQTENDGPAWQPQREHSETAVWSAAMSSGMWIKALGVPTGFALGQVLVALLTAAPFAVAAFSTVANAWHSKRCGKRGASLPHGA